MIETQSQKAAYRTLKTMATIHYSSANPLPLLSLRLNALVVAATGLGKSFLVSRLASEFGAKYILLTRSNWLPIGVKSGRPALFQVLDGVASHEKVLLHLDELDKWRVNMGEQEWAASTLMDLFAIIERVAPVEEYLRETPFIGEGAKPTVLTMKKWLRTRLFIVGSGAWQDVFESNRAGSSVGFSGATKADKVTGDTIAAARLIPSELLHRFCSDLIFLDPPDREETREILETSGIQELARKMGKHISPEDVDWSKGGMRALETVATRLVIESQQFERELLIARARTFLNEMSTS